MIYNLQGELKKGNLKPKQMQNVVVITNQKSSQNRPSRPFALTKPGRIQSRPFENQVESCVIWRSGPSTEAKNNLLNEESPPVKVVSVSISKSTMENTSEIVNTKCC